ncbi:MULTISPECIES: MSHA biogenesis protein MshP [Vibrio]|uniref:MSHA biogenesis protein MshP n=1 Tax=Vibrio splendidus TaxID=29497 RepID=A0A2N7JQC9_VIBSP|nr:MSHA biogenesis protein MshP [Vibrio splendidus]PMM51702.1 MSHA biogenesis protein MshP [Vibrio splendidus]
MSRSYQQRGSALIIVIFVIIIVGFLATSLTRTSWSTHDTNTRSVMGTQAWLLSHSVNEFVMTQFYPELDPAASSAVSAICTNLEPLGLVSEANSLISRVPMNCSLNSLECSSRGELDGSVFYVLESSVICGSGVSQVQRNQEVWVRE